MTRLVSLRSAPLALALLGCSSGPVMPLPSGEVVATIHGAALPDYYLGTGAFTVGSGRVPTRPSFVAIRSSDGNSSAPQSITMSRPGTELPEVGRHVVGGPSGFSAAYEIVVEGTRFGYTAYEGQVDINLSTPERLEGTFSIHARRNCVGTASSMSCVVPAPVDAPSVDIQGTFTAYRR